MKELFTEKMILVIFIVVAGITALVTGNKDIALMTIGGALAIISPKQQATP